MTDVVVVIGAGSIGQAIARRVSAGKHVLLADLRQENADAAAEVLADAGFETSTAVVDVSLPKSVRVLVEQATASTSASAEPARWLPRRAAQVVSESRWCLAGWGGAVQLPSMAMASAVADPGSTV
jgi:NAD(P)-dependent dehydrogenase (short-subunit alcohol dehydrogenase family)